MNSNMEKPYVVGIDIGGTNTVFGIVDARGTIIASSSIKTGAYAHGIQRRHPSNEFPDKDWDDVINTNLNSVFWLSRAVWQARTWTQKIYSISWDIQTLVSQWTGTLMRP